MPLPPEESLDNVKIKIKQAYSNERVRNIQQVVLKEGLRVFKIATILEIINPKTKKFHHLSLKIDSIDRRKAGWFSKPEKSLRLDGKKTNEIEKLYKFFKIVLEEKIPENMSGELHIIESKDYMQLENLIDVLPKITSVDKIELLKTVIKELDDSVSDVNHFVETFKNTNQRVIQHIATTSRIVQYRQRYDKLQRLINDPDTRESQLQKHLEKNPWMFGSEYSELLDRRTWTRDDSLDFMCRRSVDDILEIIEIKTPFKESLFNYDASMIAIIRRRN